MPHVFLGATRTIRRPRAGEIATNSASTIGADIKVEDHGKTTDFFASDCAAGL